MKLLRFAFTIVLLLSPCLECRSDDGRTHLEDGLRAYQDEADFDRAISELQKAVQMGLDDRADLIQAHLYLGFAHVGRGQGMAAEAEFAKAVKLDPSLSLDPKLHSGKVVTIFNGTKDRLVDSLTVVSVPGEAQVFLDGKSVGITPLSLTEILLGEHALRIVKQFFQPETLSIEVEKGKDNRVRVQLNKKEIELLVTSQPTEAAVYISDKYKGRTPLSLGAVLGQELTIKVAREEFLDKEFTMRLSDLGVSVSHMEDVTPIEDGIGRIHVKLSPAPPPGTVRIATDPPGATVYLDGITIGETPLTIGKVTPGVRRLRVSMSGFRNDTREVEIFSDRETVVEILLGGQLNIRSIPTGAQVFVDGEYVGVAPLKTERIPAGSHQLRLAMENHRDKLSAVLVERGQEKSVDVRLLAIRGSIAVSSDPPGAAVYLDGEGRGSAPLLIYGVMVGRHSLRLEKEGYQDWERLFEVEELKVSWQFGKLRPGR